MRWSCGTRGGSCKYPNKNKTRQKAEKDRKKEPNQTKTKQTKQFLAKIKLTELPTQPLTNQVSHKDVTDLYEEMSVISDSDKSSSSKLMDSEIKAAAKAAKAAEKVAAKAVAAAAKAAEKEAAKAAKEAEKAAAKAAKAAAKAEKPEGEAKKPGRPKKEATAAASIPLETEIAELRLKMAALQEQCMSLQAKMDIIRAAVAP